MNRTIALLGLLSMTFAGTQATPHVLEDAINQNDPKLVEAYRKFNEQHGLRLSISDKEEYVMLAQAQVAKKKSIPIQPRWKALLSLDGFTGLASAILLIGGIIGLKHSLFHTRTETTKKDKTTGADKVTIKDEWADTPWKTYSAFLIGIGQGCNALAGIYKNWWQTEKAKDAVKNAEQVLILVEALPAT